ncbi:MAG TPA: SDR family oxidoreductase [Tepidisphaeraceae bacterium]|jgi:uncharacterized oxidoreductase
MRMTNNTILITGGGSGIGRGLAEAFAKLGNRVVIAGRSERKLNEVVTANPGMRAFTVDMTDTASIRDFSTRLATEVPDLNAVVHNAGVMRMEDLLDPNRSLADAEETLTTNLLGPIRLTAELLPTLLKQPSATILTVTSGLAFVPLAATPTYCATKAGLHSFTQSLRYQLKKTNVRVIEIVPPYVQTTLTGDHHATDPRAMPLDEYIAEVMKILTDQPDTTEVNVGRVRPLRYAAEQGAAKYDAFVDSLNGQMAAGE